MRINVSLGKPKDGESTDETDTLSKIFTAHNFRLLVLGIGVGIILKQQAEIINLKRTLNIVSEIHHG